MPYTAADIRARQFVLRMLLVAPPKAGKSTCAVGTCPKPCFVLNTDGIGSLDYAVLAGLVKDSEMDVEDISSTRRFEKAIAYLKTNRSKYKTIILDNLTFLADMITREVLAEMKDGRQAYPEIERRLIGILQDLMSLPPHLIVIGHVDPSDENKVPGSFGHILSIAGKAKTKIPSMMQDWVWLQVSVGEETKQAKYEFLLAPEGHWKQAVRSIKTDAKRMEANITKFIELASKRARSSSLKPNQPAK